MYITLSKAKQHLVLDESFRDDDQLIISYINAAESAVSKHLDRPLEECLVNGRLDPSVENAVLLLLGSFYANRESVTFGKGIALCHGLEYLIQLNRRFSVG